MQRFRPGRRQNAIVRFSQPFIRRLLYILWTCPLNDRKFMSVEATHCRLYWNRACNAMHACSWYHTWTPCLVLRTVVRSTVRRTLAAWVVVMLRTRVLNTTRIFHTQWPCSCHCAAINILVTYRIDQVRLDPQRRSDPQRLRGNLQRIVESRQRCFWQDSGVWSVLYAIRMSSKRCCTPAGGGS